MIGLFLFRPLIAGFFFMEMFILLTHSFDKAVFFSGHRILKKTYFSLTHPIFAEKSQKTNYSFEIPTHVRRTCLENIKTRKKVT